MITFEDAEIHILPYRISLLMLIERNTAMETVSIHVN